MVLVPDIGGGRADLGGTGVRDIEVRPETVRVLRAESGI